MTLNTGLLSSNNEHLCTPPEVLDPVYRFGPIALDPCSNDGSLVESSARLTVEEDGLAWPWPRGLLTYVNPPYGKKMPAWMQKILDEASRGCEVISLVPFRPDTAYWQNLILPTCQAICAWRGRIGFIDPATGEPVMVWSNKEEKYKPSKAPFPSAVVYWGQREMRFANIFARYGRILTAA